VDIFQVVLVLEELHELLMDLVAAKEEIENHIDRINNLELENGV
jgi:hypothetical protein